jgi:hypothetical protein
MARLRAEKEPSVQTKKQVIEALANQLREQDPKRSGHCGVSQLIRTSLESADGINQTTQCQTAWTTVRDADYFFVRSLALKIGPKVDLKTNTVEKKLAAMGF